MASSGKTAWERHFKGKGDIKTTMMKDSVLLSESGISQGRIAKGSEIIFLKTEKYREKAPIEYNGKTYCVPFRNIHKPKSKSVTGIKIKPQDFRLFEKETWDAQELARELIDEIDNRKDLDPDLKKYLTTLTRYWGNLDSASSSEISRLKTPSVGVNEIKKDYGEILGAIACVTHKILAAEGIKVSGNAKINFPLRYNEPIVDYCLLDGKKKRVISAKSGTNTNTLKASNIIEMLKSKGIYTAWQRKGITKIVEIVADNTTVQFPFAVINMLAGKKVLNDEAMAEAMEFKAPDLSTKNYNLENFTSLIQLIDMPSNKKKPTIGELFYYTEKYVVNILNSERKYNPTELFTAATAGLVIYVNYDITESNKQGMFDIMISNAQDKTKKGIKWRSHNATTRAQDKLGLQP